MPRRPGTPGPVREGEGLPHGKEKAVSGFESRLAHCHDRALRVVAATDAVWLKRSIHA